MSVYVCDLESLVVHGAFAIFVVVYLSFLFCMFFVDSSAALLHLLNQLSGTVDIARFDAHVQDTVECDGIWFYLKRLMPKQLRD